MKIDCRALFVFFSRMALMGFGGVLPLAYRELVDRSRWLSDEEFGAQLALAQMLPGPTICNMAVMVGQRFAGVPGACAALAGLLAGPVVIVIALGMAYRELAASPLFGAALQGMAAVASGLILATAARLAKGMWRDAPGMLARRVVQGLLLVLAFAGLSVLKLGLLLVVGVLAPLGFVLFACVRRLS